MSAEWVLWDITNSGLLALAETWQEAEFVRKVRLEGQWVCRNTEDGECVEWDHGYHDERGWGCGWYLWEVPDEH